VNQGIEMGRGGIFLKLTEEQYAMLIGRTEMLREVVHCRRKHVQNGRIGAAGSGDTQSSYEE
jgi:hypothetical protein